MARGFRLGLSFALMMSAGCGSGNQAALSPVDAAAQSKIEGLNEAGSLLLVYKQERNKTAAKIEDLTRYEPGLPVGYQRVKNGEIVILWGTPIAEGATDTVLAYEKTTPESGGYVLMQDGLTVKKMTAEEFKAAKKAPGKASS